MQEQFIHNCYDSHVHLLATGQVASGLNLNFLKSLSDLSSIQKNPEYFRGEWLVGFGWDQHSWGLPQGWPDKVDLDQFFDHVPVYFSRIDGHTGWFNSIAQKKLIALGFDFENPKYQNQILRNGSEPSGILLDQAHIDAMMLLPAYSDSQEKMFLKKASQVFIEAGFTHVRDLSSSAKLWKQLEDLHSSGDFSLCVEGNITIESIQDLDRGLQDYQEAKKSKCIYLRMKGLKVFVDGSLGSKTAALFENYVGENHKGYLYWNEEDIAQVIRQCWGIGAEASFHTIGDRAVDLVVKTARKVSASGIMGRVNLEHVQVIKTETVLLMKSLHFTCYMQPCHWLSDKTWLKETVPSATYSQLFQWEKLRKNKIAIRFGSDSPIEKAGLHRNFLAIEDAAKARIPKLTGDLLEYHSHPDRNWCPSMTSFNSEKITQVIFDGQEVYKS